MIYRLKQEIGNLLRHATRQQGVAPQATHAIHALPGFSRGAREWLQDVVSHLDSIMSNLRRLSGDLSALTDTFFNANANRLNRLVTYVTIGSIFFVVWTLVTVAALIDERFRMHHRRAEKIHRLISEQPRSAHEIAHELWGNVAVTQAYLTLSEVLGHVDLLLRDGRAVEDEQGGVVRFSAI